jgi:MEMO1 family protein
MKKSIVLAFAAVVVIAGSGWFLVGGPDWKKAAETGGQGETSGRVNVRKAAVAGLFYPDDREKLERAVADTLKQAARQQFSHPIKAILAPHAGYVYCGETMGAAFKQIEGDAFQYDTVVMLGPSHHVPTKAAAVSSADFWDTPLGRVPVDTELAKKFVEKSDRIELDDRAHAREHSLEVQLPYLLTVAKGKPFKIVPLVTNSNDPQDWGIVGRALGDLASKPSTLVLISSDLSHFPDAGTAEKVDKAILEAVASLEPKKLLSEDKKLLQERYPGLAVTMCGLQAAMCLEDAVGRLGIDQARILSCTNSAKASGDTKRVVGYGAVIFTASGRVAKELEDTPPKIVVGEEARKELIARAREGVKAAVEGKWRDGRPCENPELQVKAGCFVTLKNHGKLRGCIGCFQSDKPLWKTVADIAGQSAVFDPRFITDRITPKEVSQLDVEISILSPLYRISRPLEQIKLGRDGIVIRDKGRSGTFLPQVATETGWSLEEFLGHCSRDKAGLGWDGWKSPSAQIYTYTCTIVKEEDARKAH